jgi:isoleucyl-tRNA synthetase
MDLSRLAAPVMCFTAEEVWQELETLHGRERLAGSTVHAQRFPEGALDPEDPGLIARWERLLDVREEVSRALESARAEKRIGTALEAKLRIEAPDALRGFLESFGPGLRFLFITSGVEFGPAGPRALRSERHPGLAVEVLRADGSKCERCWNYVADVGLDPELPGVCGRCSAAVREILSSEGAG